MTDPLDRFRRAAKALKAAYETGARDARDRLKAHPPRAGEPLKHADFLYVIARENTFVSWPVMKAAIETHGLDRATKLQRLKAALLNGQTGVTRRLLDATPDLAQGQFGLLCALLDLDSVRAMLHQDPRLAVTPAGAFLPMVHLCGSRMYSVWPDKADNAITIAELLLANGADVNARSTDINDPVSPLYWALGRAGNMALAQWLLENGATPNDGESLYHATELGHTDGVKLLLKHGADPKQTSALLRALDFDDASMVQMLLEGGADPNELQLPALHHAARRMSSGPVLDLLLQHGADGMLRLKGHSAYAFAKVFGNSDLVARLEAAGHVTTLNEVEQTLATAATGQVPASYIDPAKVADVYRDLLREILHIPGKLPHLKALVAAGMEWDRPDSAGVTPVQAAGWFGLPDVLAYFLSLAPDLGHVNSHGGTLLGAILNGSENNPKRASADYEACARLVLKHGVALPRRAIDSVGHEGLRSLLGDWAARHPGQVVAHGIS